MSSVVMLYSMYTREGVNVGINHGERKKALFVAREALAETKELLIAGSNVSLFENVEEEEEEGKAPEPFLPGGVPRSFNISGCDVTVTVEDEAEKLNINTASDEDILSMLKGSGMDEDLALTITDSILDWRDSDDLRRVNGAEEDYYESLDIPYKPTNGPFRSIFELLLVRGVTDEIFWNNPGIWDLFTVYSSGKGGGSLTLRGGGTYRFIVNVKTKRGVSLTLIWWGIYNGSSFREVERYIK